MFQSKHSHLPVGELGSVPCSRTPLQHYLLSFLCHQFPPLCWIIQFAHKCNFSHLKTKQQEQKTVPPSLFCQLFLCSLYSKTTFSISKYSPFILSCACSMMLNPMVSSQPFAAFGSLSLSSSKHFLYSASRMLLSVLSLPHCYPLSLLLVLTHLMKLRWAQSLAFTVRFIYTHSLGKLISSHGFKYYDMLMTLLSSPSLGQVSKFQIYIFNRLLDISSWISIKYLKLMLPMNTLPSGNLLLLQCAPFQ